MSPPPLTPPPRRRGVMRGHLLSGGGESAGGKSASQEEGSRLAGSPPLRRRGVVEGISKSCDFTENNFSIQFVSKKSENIHLLSYTSEYQMIKRCMFLFSLRLNIHQIGFSRRNLSFALLVQILFQSCFHKGNTLFPAMKHFVSPDETKCFDALCDCETHSFTTRYIQNRL